MHAPSARSSNCSVASVGARAHGDARAPPARRGRAIGATRCRSTSRTARRVSSTTTVGERRTRWCGRPPRGDARLQRGRHLLQRRRVEPPHASASPPATSPRQTSHASEMPAQRRHARRPASSHRASRPTDSASDRGAPAAAARGPVALPAARTAASASRTPGEPRRAGRARRRRGPPTGAACVRARRRASCERGIRSGQVMARSSAAGKRAASRSRSRKMPRADGSHRRALETRDVLVGVVTLKPPICFEKPVALLVPPGDRRLQFCATFAQRRRRRAVLWSHRRRASPRFLAARGDGARASPTPSRARRESAAMRTSLDRSAACTSSTSARVSSERASRELRQEPRDRPPSRSCSRSESSFRSRRSSGARPAQSLGHRPLVGSGGLRSSAAGEASRSPRGRPPPAPARCPARRSRARAGPVASRGTAPAGRSRRGRSGAGCALRPSKRAQSREDAIAFEDVDVEVGGLLGRQPVDLHREVVDVLGEALVEGAAGRGSPPAHAAAKARASSMVLGARGVTRGKG